MRRTYRVAGLALILTNASCASVGCELHPLKTSKALECSMLLDRAR